jgi:hypothetical protein
VQKNKFVAASTSAYGVRVFWALSLWQIVFGNRLKKSYMDWCSEGEGRAPPFLAEIWKALQTLQRERVQLDMSDLFSI